MKQWRSIVFGIAVTTAAGTLAHPALAQQEGGEKPKPAAREYPPILDAAANQQDQDQPQQAIQPDSQPLSSIQNPTVGTAEIRHSYWVPGIKYSNAVLSNSLNAAANSGWNTTSFVSGDASLLENWGHALLSANYSGGGFFSSDPTQGNGQYHQLATAYEIDQRRWQLLTIDQFSYLPQTGFGFGGPTELGLPGINGALAVPLPGLQPAYLPNQTILATNGPRYSNAAAAQLTVTLSPRSSLSFAGVYGLLRFVDPGNLNSDSEIFNGGYNYEISPKDTVGVTYTFSAYHFQGNPQAVGNHLGQFVYGRKITGRLALRLGGGPEITEFRVPIGGVTQKVSGSGSAALVYKFVRSSVSLNYLHGVGDGSGVFTGSLMDQTNATWTRQLTREWNARLTLGFARNSPVIATKGVTSPVFDAWQVGGGLGRPLGRDADITLGYQAQIQSSNVTVCGGPTCGGNYTLHQIFITVDWHTRPMVIR